MQGGCVQVIRVSRILGGLETKLIAGTKTGPTFDATARHPRREDSGIMVAAFLLALHKRLTTKLAGANDQG